MSIIRNDYSVGARMHYFGCGDVTLSTKSSGYATKLSARRSLVRADSEQGAFTRPRESIFKSAPLTHTIALRVQTATLTHASGRTDPNL
jgi:hypothetical protein